MMAGEALSPNGTSWGEAKSTGPQRRMEASLAAWLRGVRSAVLGCHAVEMADAMGDGTPERAAASGAALVHLVGLATMAHPSPEVTLASDEAVGGCVWVGGGGAGDWERWRW